jgi:hypothetical protein
MEWSRHRHFLLGWLDRRHCLTGGSTCTVIMLFRARLITARETGEDLLCLEKYTNKRRDCNNSVVALLLGILLLFQHPV